MPGISDYNQWRRKRRSRVHPPAGPAGGIREEYGSRLPASGQQWVTRFGGKAASAQPAPRLVLSPLTAWAVTLGQLALAVILSAWLLMALAPVGLVLLPVTWVFTLNALRKLQTTFSHAAVHQSVSPRESTNRAVQVVSSTVSFVHNFDDYFDDHVRGHHSRRIFTTAADPDAAFLLVLGFTPGLSVGHLWRRLRITVISPRFHGLFLAARCRTNLVTASWPRRILAIAWLSLLGALTLVMPWWVLCLAVLVPLVPLYHISALLQFLSEHAWLVSEVGPLDPSDYAARCWGRFCLEPLPDPALTGTARLTGWLRWASRMALVQAPWRYGVLVGELCVHDYHHLFPRDHAWWTSFWGRQAAIDGGAGRGMEGREFYGPTAAIDAVFNGLAGAGQARSSADRRDRAAL